MSCSYLVRLTVCCLWVLALQAQDQNSNEILPYSNAASAWGPWGDYSECSRTCGIGVASQERMCLVTGDEAQTQCIGPSRVYRSCNIQDCPVGAQEFRVEQCERYNSVSFQGRLYEWEPYTGGPNQCELNCLAKGENFYVRHATKVEDGTPCRSGSRDICVDGTCKAVGCDLMLESDVKNDKCGECGGDGTTCKTVSGLFKVDIDTLKIGYNDILYIPTGSTHISIEETEPSGNYLAIHNTTGHYFLNGNYRIDLPKELEIGGTTFSYRRKPHFIQAPETLFAQGPTTQPIAIALLSQGNRNAHIRYEYSIRRDGGNQVKSDLYEWRGKDWGQCSKSCNTGFQSRQVGCYDIDGVNVADYYCDPAEKLDHNRTCNTQPCPASWKVGDWSSCTKTCSHGYQFRVVVCQDGIQSSGPSVLQDDDVCLRVAGVKPSYQRKCNEHVSCPTWEVGTWSACNTVCGKGKQTRQVVCRAQHQMNNVISDILPDSRCAVESKPESSRECESEKPCAGVEWMTGGWSECLSSCEHGSGMQSREVLCSSQDGRLHPDTMCNKTKKPDQFRACQAEGVCPQAQWYTGEWSKCSVTCGEGIQRRSVVCIGWDSDSKSYREVASSKCDTVLQPQSQQECFNGHCDAVWITGPWNKCSRSCGGGTKSRLVTCFSKEQGQQLDSTMCNRLERPFQNEVCNAVQCKKGKSKFCLQAPFGCCPDSTIPADGPNNEGCPTNDGEVACEGSEFGCCWDRVTSAEGPFKQGCPRFTCKDTKYGCCDDKRTPKSSATGEGCPVSYGCQVTAYGCCPDNKTPAEGSNYAGCKKYTQKEQPVVTYHYSEAEKPEFLQVATNKNIPQCSGTEHGCCSDGLTPAEGPNNEGCFEGSGDVDCETSEYGCCQDGVTMATGPNKKGCLDVSVGRDKEVTEPMPTTLEDFPTEMAATEETSSRVSSTNSLSVDSLSTPVDNSNPPTVVNAKPFVPTRFRVRPFVPTVPLPVTDSPYVPVVSEQTTAVSEQTTPVSEQTTPISEQTTPISEQTTPVSEQTNLISEQTTLVSEQTTPVSEQSMAHFEQTTTVIKPTAIHVIKHKPFVPTTPVSDWTSIVQTMSTPPKSGFASSKRTSIAPVETTGNWQPQPFVPTDPKTSGKPKPFIPTEYSVRSNYIVPSESSKNPIPYVPSETSDKPTIILTTLPSDEKMTSKSFKNRTKTTETVTAEFTSATTMQRPVQTFMTTNKDNLTTESSTQVATGTAFLANNSVTSSITKQTSSPTKPPPFVPSVSSDVLSTTQFPIVGGCAGTQFGCCDDGLTAAVGPKQLGCNPIRPPLLGGCAGTQFGCCEDGLTSAGGPNKEGCHCQTSKYGCCDDGTTSAEGPNKHGCPDSVSDCVNSQYGCCGDHKTRALGPGGEGCPIETVNCAATEFGCCNDEKTPAKGPNKAGCPGGCETTLFGCCADGVTAVQGPAGEGCPQPTTSCQGTEFGCCPDGVTPAKDRRGTGCAERRDCLDTRWGCCGDGYTIAQGPYGEGCSEITIPDCAISEYGCCDDGSTKASGPDGQGCPALVNSAKNCHTSSFGCCPDNKTPAQGFNNEGCPGTPTPTPCDDTEFGCCPDAKTPAQGDNYRGCDYLPCDITEFGCCPDGRTPSEGKLFKNCEFRNVIACLNSEHGCCPDSDVAAGGPNYEGCPGIVKQRDLCVQPKERGPCRNFKVMWFHDTNYGGCNHFWYSGCGGNENRFQTRDACRNMCVNPAGDESCLLPKSPGSCKGSVPRWYFDQTERTCRLFTYSGCLGNGNNFKTLEECQGICTAYLKPNDCELPAERGPCRGSHERWYFHEGRGECIPFIYGGCFGNKNRFLTKRQCQSKCDKEKAGNSDMCALPKSPGPCKAYITQWFFNWDAKQCQEFTYGGCDGNDNRFESRKSCEAACRTNIPKSKVIDSTCFLPKDPGPCYRAIRKWYYDVNAKRCRWFTFGGCDGNRNNFNTRNECEELCGKAERPALSVDPCKQPKEQGPCEASLPRWFYNSASDRCESFVFGGCGGNENNFETKSSCVTTCNPKGQDIDAEDICKLKKEVGPCRGANARWYYNAASQSCEPFVYGGCHGNKNNFKTRQECQHVCRSASTEVTQTNGVSVADRCTLLPDRGPCPADQPRWFYNNTAGQCSAFVYGGCLGNANRFMTKDNCEEACSTEVEVLTQPTEAASSEETRTTVPDVCSLPLDQGPCQAFYELYYYDSNEGACRVFYYGGCGGNDNRFTTLEQCAERCGGPVIRPTTQPQVEIPLSPVSLQTVAPTQTESVITQTDSRTVDNNVLRPRGGDTPKPEQPGTANTGKDTSVCFMRKDRGHCKGYNPTFYYDAKYGVCRRFVYGGCGGNGNRFETNEECESLCKGVTTPSIITTSTLPTTTEPVNPCEQTKKVGPCRALVTRWFYNISSQRCERFRYGGCDGNQNNFESFNDCVQSCGSLDQVTTTEVAMTTTTLATTTTETTTQTTTVATSPSPACARTDFGCCLDNQTPAEGYNLKGCPEEVPSILDVGELNLDIMEGDQVLMPCNARGSPVPQIQWYYNRFPILFSMEPRYHVTASGSFEIRGVNSDDAGSYICRAFNGVGRSALREYILTVRVPASIEPGPNQISAPPGASGVTLACQASGVPPPTVTWSKDGAVINPDERRQVNANNSLLISNVDPSDSGEYMCLADNTLGVDEQLVTLTVEAPVSASLSPLNTTYIEGSTIRLKCRTRGYPNPTVTWYKDGVSIPQSVRHRFKFASEGEIVIQSVKLRDSGNYTCTATNSRETFSTSLVIKIKPKVIPVPDTCVDRPQYANCKLIVRVNLCNHERYGEFCCRSCHIAGKRTVQ